MSYLKNLETIRKKHFPMSFPDGNQAVLASSAEIDRLMDSLWSKVFGSFDSELAKYQLSVERRDRDAELFQGYYSAVHREGVIFRNAAGNDFGWFFGDAEDFHTFYLRNGGFAPEARGAGIAGQFLGRFLNYLRDLGYERVTAQVQPNNSPMLISYLKQGFVIEGMNLDERWGPLVKFLYLLHPDRQVGFEKVFRLRSVQSKG